MNSFIGKIHLTQDKLMSVEMWYVDATPWFTPLDMPIHSCPLAEECPPISMIHVRYYNYFASG